MAERSGVCGIVLAAGAGVRFGGPKALVRTPEGRPWVQLAVEALREGGCDDVVVVLGAGADAAASLLPAEARAVLALDWARGVSRSVRAGLTAAAGAEAVVVVPVDTPDLPAPAVARVIAAAREPASGLVRATYGGRPGHPVLLGAEHWPQLSADLTGDTGAGPYLTRRGAAAVECGDLWSGLDVDRR